MTNDKFQMTNEGSLASATRGLGGEAMMEGRNARRNTSDFWLWIHC